MVDLNIKTLYDSLHEFSKNYIRYLLQFLRVQGLHWYEFRSLLAVSEPNEELILSGCCNQKGFCHLQAAFQRRSISADLVGFLLCLGFWP